MPNTKPMPVRLREMVPGQMGDFFALLAERTKGATRDGKPYYSCRFRDIDRTVSYMVWADGGRYEDCEQLWREGTFYKIRGVYQEHRQFGPQIEVHNIRPVNDGDVTDGFDPLEFVDTSRFDSAEMFAELLQITSEHIEDEPLRQLVLTILHQYEEPLKTLPATQRHFYPFHGGLLEHILSVTRSCIFLADLYHAKYGELQPPINKDLVVAGAILHDIGRVLEFDDRIVAVEPTIPGRLLGHLFLGRDIVRDTAREIADLHPELLQLLEHLVISHLNLPEWGSPRLPLIPESLILHHADDLDAKVEMYARCLHRDTETGPFTARDSALHRQLFKGRQV